MKAILQSDLKNTVVIRVIVAHSCFTCMSNASHTCNQPWRRAGTSFLDTNPSNAHIRSMCVIREDYEDTTRFSHVSDVRRMWTFAFSTPQRLQCRQLSATAEKPLPRLSPPSHVCRAHTVRMKPASSIALMEKQGIALTESIVIFGVSRVQLHPSCANT